MTRAGLVLCTLFAVACDNEPDPTAVVDDFTPKEAFHGEVVTVYGSNFSNVASSNKVFFGIMAGKIQSASEREIKVKVPDGIAGLVPLHVEVNGKDGEPGGMFRVLGALQIAEYVPVSGTAGTTVTVIGNSFSEVPSENEVRFAHNKLAVVTSATMTTLQVKVPDDAMTGTISIKRGGKMFTTETAFLVVPTISSISPTSGSHGSYVTFTGTGLVGIVEFEGTNTPAVTISNTVTKLVVAVPIQTVANASITFRSGTSAIVAPQKFTPTSPWVAKADFPGPLRKAGIAFSVGSKFYFGFGTAASGPPIQLRDFWEYDAGTNIWSQKLDFPRPLTSAGVGFALGSKGYMLNPDEFVEYAPESDTWTTKPAFPGVSKSRSVALVIGSKAYIGTGSSVSNPASSVNDFWEYDANGTWTKKADFIGAARSYAIGFVFGGKGYIGGGVTIGGGTAREIFEYDAEANAWVLASTMPPSGVGSEPISFSIGDFGFYVNNLGDPYKFDRTENTVTKWHQMAHVPEGSEATKAVQVSNRAFVISGQKMWEFIP